MTVTSHFLSMLVQVPEVTSAAQSLTDQAGQFGAVAQFITAAAIAIIGALSLTIWHLWNRIVEKDLHLQEINEQFRESERKQLETLTQITSYLEEDAAARERHAVRFDDHDERVRAIKNRLESEIREIRRHLSEK